VFAFTSVRPSWAQSLAAAQLAGGGHGFSSHRASARLHELDGFERVELTELSSTRRLKVDGAIVHRVVALDRCDIVEILGIPTTGLARTLCDLGSVVGPDLLERALDSARRAGVNLRWVRETAERLHRPGQAGTAAILRLLNAVQHGATVRGSWFERLVELMLDDPRIPPFVRQFEVRDAAGHFVARPDLAIPSLKFGIEAHSRQFHFGRLPEGADEDRDHRFVRIGWDVMYLGYQSTQRPAATLELVVSAVEERRRLIEGGPQAS
jgi:hypothetical protein